MGAHDAISPKQFGILPYSERHSREVDAAMDRAHFKSRTINLDEMPLRASQAKVSRKTVTEYSDPSHPQAQRDRWGDDPEVIEHNGQRVIWNGHHRIAAALARGDSSMRVNYQATKKR